MIRKTEANRHVIENICFDANMKPSDFNRRVFQHRKEDGTGHTANWYVTLGDTQWDFCHVDRAFSPAIITRMKVKVITQIQIEVIESYDEENDFVDSTLEVFSIGEILEFDIFDNSSGVWDIQFGNGSVAYSVNPEWFEVLEYER
jgi:hypothetical protein